MRIVEQLSDTRITVLSYGASGSGKTQFAATFPDALFLADAVEGGHKTVLSMDPGLFYTPGKRPEIWEIESSADLHGALDKVEERVKTKRDLKTLVVDSITFAADLYFDQVERLARQSCGGKDPDTRKLYGSLKTYLRGLMIRVHRIPIHVVWTALAKMTDDGQGGVALAGQSATILPAACDFIFYHRQYQEDDKYGFEIRTRHFGGYMARGRDGGKLPDPIDPTYRTIMQELDWNQRIVTQPARPAALQRAQKR